MSKMRDKTVDLDSTLVLKFHVNLSLQLPRSGKTSCFYAVS